MPRQKMNRYEKINQDPRVVQWLQNQHILFPDATHIVLELACGRWEYSIWLAQATREGKTHYEADTLFIWVDSKWDRIGVWLDRVHQAWLQQVRFVCGIVHHIDHRFAPTSIDEIWIIHPDPRPRDRDIKRRLTHPRFLELYKKILKPWWVVRLKTDDRNLFDYSVAQFQDHGRKNIALTHDLHTSPLLAEHHAIQTHYEKLALEEWRKINYWVWQKN